MREQPINSEDLSLQIHGHICVLLSVYVKGCILCDSLLCLAVDTNKS